MDTMMKISETLNKSKEWVSAIKKLHPAEIIILLILPSPSWPFYFIYKNEAIIKYKKISDRCKIKIRRFTNR